MSSTETSGSGDLARTLELLWNTGPRPSRGPKPGLTLDRIVEAAIHVADAEGLDAVTMRRVATELGTGTMTLYRYLPGKAELLDLMLDRVQDPQFDGLPEPEAGWRAALEAVAYSTLALYQRHPWLIQVNQSRPVMGPSAVEGMERILARIKPMGLPDRELISVVLLIDNYVVGAARTQLYAQEAELRTGMTDLEFWEAQAPALNQAMATGRYPILAGMGDNTFDPSYDHFGWGLQRVLDGLERTVVGDRPE
ncbi:TetR/AcrR family transcriptional regulator [Nocardia otitidiscaviarum]|uniref:TetR/AcrR family transcriptional regulator n=1 Tax=Nocardia otitidiscaviarum TaxID=1823 RepID=A0A516NVP5_9NOCA|nr:TetR/AcrR family transcriptional regulator [Nocardia otitidiscaviarum]MBF6182878.1 TetR/AcrR family transcriptional regulator C-terminal domain-containing protein [Nocardia otitidiscaviarum]MCP9622442.1 TetR/AcrR family transcriptional regulator [Nocardia otitidiscaviarum]QDP82958.1 TetR/AcrR family transcriptional regulator [Nocardia otitidiscaviarum]